VDFVDVEFGPSETQPDKFAEEDSNLLTPADPTHPKIRRTQSRAFLSEDGLPQPIEYFLASDPSAIVEHTKRVLYLEDNDIAHIDEGGELVLGLSFESSLCRKEEYLPYLSQKRTPYSSIATRGWRERHPIHHDP
jgi:hypothetical protein